MTIFDAAMRYRQEGVPLVVLAGKEYGSGSSRDWAAKGPALLGVRAVIAESFERIHRSNLVGMGVLPLQYAAGGVGRLARARRDRDLRRLGGRGRHRTRASACGHRATADGARTSRSRPCVRIDGAAEVDYYRHGGILQMVLRQMLAP